VSAHIRPWPPGPWDGELDRVVVGDLPGGLIGLVFRSDMGHLCGYVGVPVGHPDHGKGYSAVDVEVHGGLTFDGSATGFVEYWPGGEADGRWFFGFDCAHLGDVSPAMLRYRGGEGDDTYRTVGYVRAEVVRLAEQLATRAARS